MIARTIVAFSALLLTASDLYARESMVGAWATPGRCGKPLSTIVIEPLALSGEDFFCEFRKVERRVDVVTWSGRCTFGADHSEPARVMAKLASGRLSYRIGSSGWNGPLQRCPGLAP